VTGVIARLADVAPRYGAVFCDLWGCLHNGVAAFPAAVAALQAFRARGGKVVLVTNAPRPRGSVARQLDRLGVPRDAWDEIATSGDAAQFALVTGAVGRHVHHIGAAKDEPFFTDLAADLVPIAASGAPIERVPLDQAEGLVVTGPIDDLKDVPEDYRATLLYAKTRGMKLLCANPDLVVDLGDRRMYCAGAIAALYDRMGGQSLYFGKPHPPIYDLARRRLAALDAGLTDGDILCIGDGIDTDIRGGLAEGLDTLFVTGGIDTAAFGADPGNPDARLLADWLEDRDLSPTHAIGHLQ
jgi:HAD superfamily hydrolase (TIGR01459 family)